MFEKNIKNFFKIWYYFLYQFSGDNWISIVMCYQAPVGWEPTDVHGHGPLPASAVPHDDGQDGRHPPHGQSCVLILHFASRLPSPLPGLWFCLCHHSPTKPNGKWIVQNMNIHWKKIFLPCKIFKKINNCSFHSRVTRKFII